MNNLTLVYFKMINRKENGAIINIEKFYFNSFKLGINEKI